MDDPASLARGDDYTGRIVSLPDFLGLPYNILWTATSDDNLVFQYDHTKAVSMRKNDNGIEIINSHLEQTTPKYAHVDHWKPHLEIIKQHLGYRYRVLPFDSKLIVLSRCVDLPSVIELEHKHLRKDEILFGYDIFQGEPYYVPLSKMMSYLVAGTAGMGKSTFLNALIQSLLFNMESTDLIVFIDLKGGMELFPYVDLHPQKIKVLYKFEDLPHMASDLVKHMEAIQNYCREQRIKLYPRHIWIIVDEYAQIQNFVGKDAKEKAVHKQLLADLSALARLGRAAGIHILAMLQRAEVKAISGDIRTNLQNRICFRVPDSQSAIMVFGQVDELPIKPTKLKRGQFIYQDDGGNTAVLQAPMVPEGYKPIIHDTQPEAEAV